MKEVKIEVRFTDGYQKRYTKACIEQLKKRKAKEVEKRT